MITFFSKVGAFAPQWEKLIVREAGAGTTVPVLCFFSTENQFPLSRNKNISL